MLDVVVCEGVCCFCCAGLNFPNLSSRGSGTISTQMADFLHCDVNRTVIGLLDIHTTWRV